MPRLDFTHRHLQPELMDQPGLDPAEHAQALRGLRRINRCSGSARLLWPAFREAAAQSPGRPLRVLDVACGGGDVAISLARRARRANIACRFVGCDISPVALDIARRRAAEAGIAIAFEERDVLAALPDGFDLATCSLFLHHLEAEDAVALLRRMADAARRVVVSDLRRSRGCYLLAHAACRLLTRSHVVHVDGPLSIAGAFTADEIAGLCRQAGLENFRIVHRWPCRLVVDWRQE